MSTLISGDWKLLTCAAAAPRLSSPQTAALRCAARPQRIV
jgi:hypothetical protein